MPPVNPLKLGFMNSPEYHPWEIGYVSAALETDFSKLIGHIAKARQAIEPRLATPIQVNGPEYRAIQQCPESTCDS